MGLFVFYGSLVLAGPTTHETLIAAKTALTAYLVYAGLLLILFVEPPIPWFTGAEPLTTDRRPAWLAIGLAIGFIVVLLVPPARAWFAFSIPPPRDAILVVVAVVGWTLLIRTFWRRRLVDRFLGLG
jgi:cation-transporting ATPase E